MNINKKFMTGVVAISASAATIFIINLNSNEIRDNNPDAVSSIQIINTGTTPATLLPIALQESAFTKSPAKQNDPLPIALQGTDLSGILKTDVQGNLIKDNEVRLFFDHFLLLLGQDDADKDYVRSLIENNLAMNLTEPALSQAQELLSRYWDYYTTIEQSLNDEEVEAVRAEFKGTYQSDMLAFVQEYKAEQRNLQEQYFSPSEAEAFFGSENRYEDYAFAQIKIQQSALSEQEKSLALKQLELSLPAEQREIIKETHILTRYERIRQTSGEIGSPAWYQKIEQEFGPERAQTFLKIERRERDWQAKVEAYTKQKHALLASRQLTGNDEQEELERIMRQDLGLNDFEVRRMKGLDSIL